MREQRMKHVLEEVANAEVSESVDLWPGISARIRSAGARRHTAAWLSRRRALAAGLASVVLAAALVGAGPSALALADEMLERFGVQRAGLRLVSPDFVSRLAQPTAVPAAGQPVPKWVATPQAMTPNLSIEEAQQGVSFHIPTPTWLPEGVVFRGALIGPNDVVVVSYRAAEDSSKGMGLQMTPGRPSGAYVAPASAAQEVHVHGGPATYVQGAWRPTREWDGAADAGMLSWEAAGFTYVLTFSGLGLSGEDLIRIAESLR